MVNQNGVQCYLPHIPFILHILYVSKSHVTAQILHYLQVNTNHSIFILMLSELQPQLLEQ